MTLEQTGLDVLSGVRSILVDALRKPADLIKPEARIFGDLGAESLDLLDIRFRIERMFGFKIQQDEIAKSVSGTLTAQEIRERLTVGHVVEFVERRLRERAEVS